MLMKQYILMLLCIISFSVFAQSIEISIDKTEFSTDEPLIITVTVKNVSGRIQTPHFPEIDGFISGGISTSMSSTFINGKGTTETKFMKQYYAQKDGKYTIKPFTVEVNGLKATSPETIVKVSKGIYPPKQPYKPKTPKEIEKEREIQNGKWI